MNNTMPLPVPIKIIIQKNNQEFSLQQLLFENKYIVQETMDVIIHITVSAGVTCMLVDDLVGVCVQDIKIILEQNSVVKYALHDGLEENGRCDHTFDNALAALRHPELVSGSTCYKNLTFVFAGEHAQASINCLYHGTADKKLKITITQDHQASHTSSTCLIKSVLEDQSSLKCACLIKVGKHNSGVIAQQQSKTLMLGQNASAVVIPQLEIESYDSQCWHGATLSSISEQDLFYLQSRGLGHSLAKQILVKAFLQETDKFK